MDLIETSVGLPNNCFVCGKPVAGGTWYARHIDEALSGLGGHKKCLEKHFAPPKVEEPEEPQPEE